MAKVKVPWKNDTRYYRRHSQKVVGVMRATIGVAAALCMLSLCSPSINPANIEFLSIKAIPYQYEIQFASDTHFIALYAKTNNRKNVRSELICSFTNDQNFEFGHRLTHFATGIVEFVASRELGGKVSYIFRTQAQFYESTSANMSTERVLLKSDLIPLLKEHSEVPCRVRINMYGVPEYFSSIMCIRSQKILEVAHSIGE